MPYKTTSYEYLLSKLAEVAGDDLSQPWQNFPCLEWDRWKSPFGYGLIDRRPSILSVHRFACESVNGPMGPGICALHHCDNPPCFRPIHLFPGTRAENNRDAARKGRTRTRRGTDSPTHKLEDADVLRIKELVDVNVSRQAIATQFGISKPMVGHIVSGSAWPHIIKDKILKGPANPKGGDHPRARITDSQAVEIINRYRNGEGIRYLAVEFSTTRNAIYLLVSRISFRHLEI